MKITEIVNGIYCYTAIVRAVNGKAKTTARTMIFADGINQAKGLLSAMYGKDNVLSVSRASEGQLDEAIPYRTASKPAPRILPTDYTHAIAQKALLNQMKRNALHVKPTIDDLRAAADEFETEQKRIDRAYDEALKARYKWAEIGKRRLERH